MITFGYTACGGSYSAGSYMAGDGKPETVAISKGIYDTFYGSTDMETDMTGEIPSVDDWDYSTLFNAQFNGDLKTGNTVFEAKELISMRIKRTEAGSYNWLTLTEIPINEEEDFTFTFLDFTARGNKKYKYALVPLMATGLEGAYVTNEVDSKFDGLWVCEQGVGYNIILDLDMSTTLNQVTSTVQTIGRRYPYVNKYGKANYYSGEFSGTFVHMNTRTCDIDIDNGVEYREMIEEFLTNGNPKIIKHMDGRIWLAAITDTIDKNEGDWYKLPIQTVHFVEIGKHDSSTDLYYAGLIPVNLEAEVTDELLS